MSRKRSMLLAFPKDSSTKDAIEGHLRSSGFEIKLTREVNLSPEQKAELHKRNAALGKAVDGQTAYAMVLEHPDAIARWTTVSRTALKSDIYKDCYASSSEAIAKEDIIWLKGVLKKKTAAGSSIPTAAGGSTTSSTKSAKENSKQHQRRQTAAGGSRTTSGGNRLSSTAPRRTARDPGTMTATKRGGSTRSESMTSAGRRGSPAPSRVPVKASSENIRSARIATNRNTPSSRAALRAKEQHRKQKQAQEGERQEEEVAATVPALGIGPVVGSVSTGIENSVISEAEAEAEAEAAEETGTFSDAAADGIAEPEDEDEEEARSVQGELYPSDKGEEESEHDAEVAATTQHHHRNISTVDEASTPSTLRASLSPNSITSLPRPETPEVDQLRQRFESIAQSTASMNSSIKQVPRRSSGSSPEIALKGKELKPKLPAGSRVKSMVEFFMDENLHKWEF